MLYVEEANDEAYKFWAKNQRARIHDPRKRDLLAPLKKPHPFGTKRPCLEQNFYEQFNRPNVDVVDLRGNEIKDITEKGILMEDGTEHEFDVICIATGFDITTGGMTNMGLRDINGNTLKDQWKSAAVTYLGTTVPGYPNMFHTYGPHGPTLLSNGPSTIECQGRWIANCMKLMEREGVKYINPTAEASKQWKDRVNQLSDETLFPRVIDYGVYSSELTLRELTMQACTRPTWAAASPARPTSRSTTPAASRSTERSCERSCQASRASMWSRSDHFLPPLPACSPVIPLCARVFVSDALCCRRTRFSIRPVFDCFSELTFVSLGAEKGERDAGV